MTGDAPLSVEYIETHVIDNRNHSVRVEDPWVFGLKMITITFMFTDAIGQHFY